MSAHKKKCEQLLIEKTDLISLLATRNEELAAMDQQLGELRERLTNITERNVDSDLKVNIVSLREISLNQRETRLEQEAEIKNKRITNLEHELDRLTRELNAVRMEQTTMSMDLEAKLEHKNDQLKCLKEELIHYKNGYEAKDNYMSSLSAKMRKQQEITEQLQKQYSAQTQSLQDMLNLESRALESEKKQNEKLVSAIKELQELLKCSKESHSQMERQLIEKTTEFESSIGSKDYTIRRLEREIDALKDKLRIDPREQLEQELEVFYPAASRASRSLRERSSASFTVSTSSAHIDELNRLREENARLISEAEENAPLTLAKMLEHKKAVEMITQLQNQLGQVLRERNDWLAEKETLLQLTKQQERRLRRFEQENEDLSIQVRTLLHALDESNGPSLKEQVDQYSRRSSGSSANDIVTARLVTFQSIEELQSRNRQLLAALRELGQDHEAIESMTSSVDQAEPSGDNLKKALREIESLKDERKKQAEVIEAVVKQRDALQSIAVAFTPLESFYRIPPQTNVPDPNVEYLKLKLEEREKELSQVRQQAQDRAKDANEEMMKLKDEMMQVKIEERNLSSRLESTHSNLEAARGIMEQNKTVIQSLRDRVVAEKKDCKKAEQELRKFRNELAMLNETIKKKEDLVKHLTQERDMLKISENSLRIEIESLRRENQSSHAIGETTKTLQAYIARVEADASRAKIAEALVEKLEKENSQLKIRNAKLLREAAEADENNSKRVGELKKSFISDQSEEINRLMVQVSSLRSENQDLKKNALMAKNVMESSTSKRIGELEDKLNEKGTEISKFESEIQRLNNEVNNLRKICSDKDEKLKRAVSQLNSERMSKAAEVSVEQSSEIQSRLDSLQEKLKESMNQTKVALASSAEKDEKLKKVANQARQRISVLQEQIKGLQEQNQALQVQIQKNQCSASSKSDQDAALLDQLKSKICNLEQENEELLRFRLLNAALEAKLKQVEKENQDLGAEKSHLEEKLREHVEPNQEAVAQQAATVVTTVSLVAPNNSSTVQVPPTQPVRPLPQQQPQPTKTATINPLPHPRPPTSTIAHVFPTQQTQSNVGVVECQESDENSLPSHQHPSEAAEQQEMIIDDQSREGLASADEPLAGPSNTETSQKRSCPDSLVCEPESAKRPKTDVTPDMDDSATKTLGVESCDINDDSSDHPRINIRPTNVVVDDVIVIDDNSDEERSNDDKDDEDGDEGNDDGSGSDAESGSGNQSSVEGQESDEEYSHSGEEDDDEDGESHERQIDGDDDGPESESNDQEEAIIVIGESNESQNDSRLSSGEQVVRDEEVERDDADVSVESSSQAETSSSFNERSQFSHQVFAVPEDQRIITRPAYLGQPGSSYEESDSIVPSTPTLVVPRRGDGSESLNSPRVPQNSFQFANVSRDGSPGLPETERLDDTRMNLPEFNQDSREPQVSGSGGIVQADDTPQLIAPDESAASLSVESVTPEPPIESTLRQETVCDENDPQVDQSSDVRASQPARQPIVWNAPTLIAPVRAPGPDQPTQIQPPLPGGQPVTRPRRLQLRGARAFQQTARRASGWRGGRGKGGASQ